jgi:hypothetical protein
MPQPGLIFRVLVASPGDCAQERKIIPEVITAWNAVNSLSTAAVVEPVRWETHARPEMGDRPQAIINKQLVRHCDLLIGAFWTRLGTPTGDAESGTAEEIEEFRKAGKPVLLYFSSAPVVPDSLDREQYQALLRYRRSLGEEGLFSQYETHAAFREQLQRNFASTMIELLDIHSGAHAAAAATQVVQDINPLTVQREEARQFQQQFESFLRRLRTEWAAERDSDPHSTDEGKYIFGRAADDVVHFISMITHDNSELSAILDDTLRRMKALQRHKLYVDGGLSFSAFWGEGDGILLELGKVSSILAQTAEDGISEDGSCPDGT